MTVADRLTAVDWRALAESLDSAGYAVVPDIVTPVECAALAALYDDPATCFRSTVTMARHNFGRGEYKYFAYPLPDRVMALRSAFYPPLAAIANDWAARLGEARRWPPDLAAVLRMCREAGQNRPTPLLLRYGAGDYNCLHQDLYGALHFPLQVIVQLSTRGRDFEGGELVLVEQRPRMQSRAAVVDLPRGAVAIVPVRDRPVRGARGWRRQQMRHGVSEIHAGLRQTLGLIFHDAI